MSGNLFQNRKLLIFLSIVLFILLAFSVFYFILYPKISEIAQKEIELAMQQQLLDAIEGKKDDSDTSILESSASLQLLVPVQPLTQQFILEIEKAEIISGSFVKSMTFDDSGQAEDPFQTEDEEGTEEEGEETTNQTALPEGVMRLTATLDVESPTYFEFEEFLTILEQSERITVIDYIDFSAAGEIIEEGQEEEILNYQVTISAFYMPTLTDLLDSLPKIDTPPPANKKNPFPRFGDISNPASKQDEETKEEEKEKDDEKSQEEKADENKNNGKTPTKKTYSRFIEHTVQPGDTVFSIAMKYYNANYGLDRIREANGIKNDIIRVGQKLIIPFD